MSIIKILENTFSFVCLTAIAVILAIAPNLSASNNASITMTGSVAEYMSLDMSASDFDFGDPSADDISNALIGSVTISSNSSSGWALTLSNQNDEFALQSGKDSIPYELQYDGEKLRYGAAVKIDGDNGSNGATRALSKDLSVSMKADKELNAGSYSDELTLEITAN